MQRVSDEILRERGQQLASISKEQSRLTEQAKAKARAMRERGKAFKQTDLLMFLDKCNEYTEQCYRNNQPLTHAGYILACGVNTASWYRWKAGEHDHLLPEILEMYNIPLTVIDDGEIYEHTTEDGEIVTIPLITYSEMVEKCTLAIQQQLEVNCYTNKGNPAGSIFGLKARFGWQDTPQNVGTINQTLVIADKEQAVKALEMLK